MEKLNDSMKLMGMDSIDYVAAYIQYLVDGDHVKDERVTTNITKRKSQYGLDLDTYKILFGNFRELKKKADDCVKHDDIIGLAGTMERMNETMEDIHRIFLKNNEQLCCIYNTLPG